MMCKKCEIVHKFNEALVTSIQMLLNKEDKKRLSDLTSNYFKSSVCDYEVLEKRSKFKLITGDDIENKSNNKRDITRIK